MKRYNYRNAITIHDNIREHTIKRNREEDTIHDKRTNIIRCYSMEQV